MAYGSFGSFAIVAMDGPILDDDDDDDERKWLYTTNVMIRIIYQSEESEENG